MAERARARYENYSWQVMKDVYVGIHEEVLDSRKGRRETAEVTR
jgi:hypothetical protein